MKIKAILPVAGLGTRLMPLTSYQPKAMVSVHDRPMIYYSIKEAVDVGIDEFVFVISPGQEQIKRYVRLIFKNPQSSFGEAVARGRKFHFNFALQRKPSGNGDAIFTGASYAGGQSVAVLFCDDLLIGGASLFGQAIKISKKTNSPVVVLERIPKKHVSHYGVVGAKKITGFSDSGNYSVYQVNRIVEKPKVAEAPSNLTIVGRYVLTPSVIGAIKYLYPNLPQSGRQKEIMITDALNLYLRRGGRIYGLEFKGRRFDCGSKDGLLHAQIYCGLSGRSRDKDLNAFCKLFFDKNSRGLF